MASTKAAAQHPKLGLQLVSDLAQQLGGTVNVESVQGTQFSLSFAIAQPHQ
jgi:two-component sensor histidine kinase